MEKTEFINELRQCFACHGIDMLLTGEGEERLYAISEELLRVNRYMNLTAIKDEHELIIKHLCDCAVILPHIPQGAKILDVGAGGGFPSLVIAALREDVHVTSLDATKKKMDFVQSTASLVGLSNLSVLAGRAEELAQDADKREKYDVVCARAVARLCILSELCLPFCREGGVFLAMKGPGGADEAAEARRGIATLGGRIKNIDSFELSDGDERLLRTLVHVEKIRTTPKAYPRRYQKISASPL